MSYATRGSDSNCGPVRAGVAALGRHSPSATGDEPAPNNWQPLRATGAGGEQLGARIALDLGNVSVGEELVAVGVRHLLNERERGANAARKLIDCPA